MCVIKNVIILFILEFGIMNNICTSTYMDSVKKPYLINFVFTSMLISSANCNPQFIDYFSSPGGKFYSTFALSTLKDADRQIVCNTLGRESNGYTTNDDVLLVRVQIENRPPIYPVPAFQCASRQTSFYITYVVPDLFFKMAFVSSSINEGVLVTMTIITSLRRIPDYSNTKSAISEEIFAYFNSRGYRMDAERVLKQYLLNNTWKELCAKYDPELVVASYYSDTFSVPIRPLNVGQQRITNNDIPVIICTGQHRNVLFFVVYFVNGILFKINEFYELEIDGMAPQHSDYINDVLLTSTPWLYHLLPLEIADNIRSRCKRK